MAKLLRMPEVAANAVEAVLQGWSIAENAPFAADEVIATVETEKAVVDVPAEAAGVLLKTLVPEGAGVEVGAPIALLGDPGEKVADLGALLAELGLAVPPHVTAPERRDVPDAAAQTGAPAVNGVVRRVFASPLARRMAGEAGIPYEKIVGTGPNGRIVRRDVEAAIASANTPAAPVAAGLSWTKASASFTDVPHSRLRRAVASRLTASKQDTPHFYLRGTARVDRLLKLRRRLNDGGQVRISVNDLVIKAAAQAHTLVPAMNVIWTPEAIRSYSTVDLSVAIATERGLVTPVLRSVERMTVSSVATTVRDFADRAKAGRLRQEELEGGTFSVTNLGMFGTEEFAAIINPPQAAILAVGAARTEPVVDGGKVRAGTVMRVTLSVDHRPVDGAVAAEWMRTFLSLVENPLRILA
ncbi:dihydrolipoamide acetyltransferase family protein [Sphaerisporangium corydalis]|uniref:Dihydrolipoamide acetyltransferase component of pyruvate dehydrogenase complex n=1 Tax=Sphaerisporangium corydalis TaxID=1441875 RepID=A0ABV9E7G6_9ACTN|nr:dihydrolipoamide acetyltransferase family protein [Sphaerisporangium corydalis]